MKNTIAVNGEEQCVFITDRGFYSESNISDMEQAGLAYIILLTRDSELLRYEHLSGIDKSDIYFFIRICSVLSAGQYVYLPMECLRTRKRMIISHGSIPYSY